MLLSRVWLLLAHPRVAAAAAVVAAADVKPVGRSSHLGPSSSSGHTQQCSLANLVASVGSPQRHWVHVAQPAIVSCLAAPRLKSSSMLLPGPLVRLPHTLRANSRLFSSCGAKLSANFESVWPSQGYLRTNSDFIRSRMMHAGILRAVSTQTVPSRRSSVAMQLAALHGSPLPYRGVLIDFEKEECPPEAFEERLGASLDAWRAEFCGVTTKSLWHRNNRFLEFLCRMVTDFQGKKSAVLRLPIEQSALAAVAAAKGFDFHHAKDRHVVLKCWLQPHLEDKFPAYATHQVGAGGFVLDAHRRLLVVREFREDANGDRVPGTQWKLPGGMLDAGESFAQGACREVYEETGIETSFSSILCFWHRHGLTWGKSDMYFIARLHPSSIEIRMQEDEIADCTWMPLEEFVRTQNHPLVLAICERLYGLTKQGLVQGDATELERDQDQPGALSSGDAGDSILPSVEMVEQGVGWPGREPYPTYFGTASRSSTGTPRS